jgi:hypothetical protein
MYQPHNFVSNTIYIYSDNYKPPINVIFCEKIWLLNVAEILDNTDLKFYNYTLKFNVIL